MNRKSVVTFAVAVLAIAAIADGLASRNIVGWANKELDYNANAVCAYFFNVNSAKEDGSVSLKLSDITVTGYEGKCEGLMSIQLLDGVGNAKAIYQWFEGTENRPVAGWYKMGSTVRICAENDNDVTFTQGDGLWVMCRDTNLRLKTSGEVFMDDVCFTLRKEYQMLGNPYATKIKLSDITVSGYEGMFQGDASIQLLNNVGNATAIYQWFEGTENRPVAGWYKMGSTVRVCAENENDEEFEAGKGLWVGAKAEGLTLTIKSPFEEKGDAPVVKAE